MSIIDYLRIEVDTHGTKNQLLFGFTLLCVALFIVLILYIRFVVRVKSRYSLKQRPFTYYLAIYTGILFILINEVIIIFSIILSNQESAVLAREKSLIQIIGYGLFLFGWTNIVFFNISIKNQLLVILRLVFLGAMLFYIFAVTMTFLITFEVLETGQYLGIGYRSAALIYIPFLLLDLVAMAFIAKSKSKLSNYQAWIGILMFCALLLQILSIIFNIIPVLIEKTASGKTHAFYNFIIEPMSYFITSPLTLLFLSWVLFNPKWLESRIIESNS